MHDASYASYTGHEAPPPSCTPSYLSGTRHPRIIYTNSWFQVVHWEKGGHSSNQDFVYVYFKFRGSYDLLVV
ncbi:hypothetical protein KSS87_009315 [Heliosperma pusillum]|nr:hypothetical protein KSS87_009315 [Heliosperma pusillum]